MTCESPAFSIRPARPDEARALSELAIRSKAYWRYTPEQLEIFRGELTIRPAQIVDGDVHVALEGESIRGFYAVALLDDGRAELDHLFIDPDHLGRRIGQQLFAHACDAGRRLGATALRIQSDPNAAPFYVKMGARFDAEIPSSIPGRNLPCFEYAL